MLKKLEDLVKFFPLIFILLTTLGYIHLQSYYYYFNIEILNYLDLFEIILLFFDKSILLILVVLIVIAISYILDDNLTKEINKTSNETNTQEKSSYSDDKILKKLGYLIIFLMLVHITLNLIRGNYIGLIFPTGFGICIIIFFLCEKYFFKPFIKKYSPFFFFSVIISLLAIALINIITVSSAIEKGYNVRYNHLTIKEVYFTYHNKIIKTTKQVIYIGETKKNLFLFDSQKNETIIFKTENIDNFRIKN